MTVLDLWRMVKKNIAFILLFVLLSGVIGCGFVALKKPVYTARATAYVTIDLSGSDNKTAVGTINSASSLAIQKSKSYISLFSDKSTALSVKEKLQLEEPVDLLSTSITAVNTKDAPSIQISVRSSSPDLSQKIADTAAQVVGERVQQLEGKNSPINLKLLSPASLSSPVKYPNAFKVVILSVLIGLLVGLVAAYARQKVGSRLRRPAEVSSITNLPVIGRIPSSDCLAQSEVSDGLVYEHVRKIRTALNYVAIDKGLSTVLVTSSRPDEGKSTIAAALARTISLSDKKVILVEGDLRCPTLAAKFGISTEIGLSQVLSGAVAIEDALQETDIPNLLVLTAGEVVPNPSELLGSKRMKQLLSTLASEYFVVIDSPPVLPVTDAVVLSEFADVVIVVVGMGRVREDELSFSLEALRSQGATVAGLVLNHLDTQFLAISEYSSKYGDIQ